MRKLILLSVMFCAMALFISASPVHAQQTLWVSATGNDANNCSQAAPCLSFQGAINKGNVAEINCLTSGNYGPFTVTASITVDCGTGNIGRVNQIGPNTAILLNTGAAATVILRHLSLNGFDSGVYGIGTQSFASGTLIVEDCMIHGFANGWGIQFLPSAGRGLLQVSNSQILNNKSGILVSPLNAQIATVTLNGVEMVGNLVEGLELSGFQGGVVAGTMRHSVAAANGLYGVETNGTQVYFTIEESSIIANLTYGIVTASQGSVVNVGSSTIGGNGTGVKAAAGQLISFGNNQMSANGSNGNFTSTTLLR